MDAAKASAAPAIEPHRVGRVLERLQKSALVSAHETLTALTEIGFFNDIAAVKSRITVTTPNNQWYDK